LKITLIPLLIIQLRLCKSTQTNLLAQEELPIWYAQQ